MTYVSDIVCTVLLTSIVNEDTTILSTPDLVASDDWITPSSDLDSRVHVIENIILLQCTMAIVIKVNPNLHRHDTKKENIPAMVVVVPIISFKCDVYKKSIDN